jgi:protein-tyrosine kinase
VEQIRKAIDRAKAAAAASGDPQLTQVAAITEPGVPRSTDADTRSAPISPHGGRFGIPSVELDRARIEAGRIVAHRPGDPRTKPFDMLRTQTLQGMDQSHWQFLGITSPTAGCGKTLTAINLALSMARAPERSVLLIDLDLHKPQVGTILGLRRKLGVVSVLADRAKLADVVVETQVGNLRMLVLPAEQRVIDTTELIASRAMGRMLQEIKRTFPNHLVVMDLPPLLASDDVIALLPQIDCVLLVAAVGTTTISEVKECNRHVQASTVLRVVLNKSAERAAGHYASAA